MFAAIDPADASGRPCRLSGGSVGCGNCALGSSSIFLCSWPCSSLGSDRTPNPAYRPARAPREVLQEPDRREGWFGKRYARQTHASSPPRVRSGYTRYGRARASARAQIPLSFSWFWELRTVLRCKTGRRSIRPYSVRCSSGAWMRKSGISAGRTTRLRQTSNGS
jgi:hypothetical protein